MSQTETGKATAADERTEAARSFVRTVRPESTEGVGLVSVLKRQEGAPLNLG